MAGNIIFPNDIDVAVLIHGDLRIYRATSVGGEHLRPRKRGPTVVRAAEDHIRGSKEVRTILPDHIDGAAGVHCNARVEREASTVGDALWGRKRSAIRRTAEQDIRVRVGIIFPDHVDVPTQIHGELWSE